MKKTNWKKLMAIAGLLLLFNTLSNAQAWMWARKDGISDGHVVGGRGIAADASGNYYVAGIAKGSANFGTKVDLIPASNFSYAYVAKYDPSGKLLWIQHSSNLDGDVTVNDLKIDANNIYIIGDFSGAFSLAGATISTSVDGSNQDVYLAKLNLGGNLLWSQTLGGRGIEHGSALAVSDAGQVFVTGNFTSAKTSFPLASAGFGQMGAKTLKNSIVDETNPDNTDIFTAQYDPLGNLNWVSGAGGKNKDGSIDITVDISGKAYVTGFVEIKDDDINFGNILLDKITPPGGFLTSEIFIAKYNAIGSTELAVGILHGREVKGISVDQSGQPFIIINTNLQAGFVTPKDAKLFHISAAFDNTLFENEFPGILLSDVSTTSTGETFVGGITSGFIPSIVVAKADPKATNPAYQLVGAANNVASTFSDLGHIFVDEKGVNIYCTGAMGSELTFGSATISPQGLSNQYVANINTKATMPPPPKSGGEAMRIFPNPASSSFTVSIDPASISSSEKSTTNLYIVDKQGLVVYHENNIDAFAKEGKQINCAALPVGIYIVRVTTGGTTFTERLLIERR